MNKPYVLYSDRVIYVDVDDTLVLWYTVNPNIEITFNGYVENLEINQKIVDYIKLSKEHEKSIVVWSAGGADWAKTVVDALGLTNYVDVILSKPIQFIDDLPSSEFLPEVNRKRP